MLTLPSTLSCLAFLGALEASKVGLWGVVFGPGGPGRDDIPYSFKIDFFERPCTVAMKFVDSDSDNETTVEPPAFEVKRRMAVLLSD